MAERLEAELKDRVSWSELRAVLLDKFGSRVAFGVPGALMALAAFVFWLGRKQYVHRPPQGWGKVKENFTGAMALTSRNYPVRLNIRL